MTTFSTHKVEEVKHPLEVKTAKAVWRTKVRPGPEAHSSGVYLPTTINPLVAAVGQAYNQHRALALSPDAVWLAITQGLAAHVKAHAEKLRHHFVKFEGKQYLEIDRSRWGKGDPLNDWPGAFAEFSEKIQGFIGKKHDLIVSAFSTTTPTARAASELVLMDAMEFYFRYGMRTMCGFPRITLLGTVADWESIAMRAANFTEFELGWWLDHLLPVLKQLVKTAEGDPDVEFWRSLYREGGGSGGPDIDGWINVFFPYIDEGMNPGLDWQRRSRRGGPHPNDFPSGLAKAPMLWHWLGTTYPMQLVGGLVGVEQAEDGALSPGIGWAVGDDPEAVPDHECEALDPFSYTDCTCRLCGRGLDMKRLNAQQAKLLEPEVQAIMAARGLTATTMTQTQSGPILREAEARAKAKLKAKNS